MLSENIEIKAMSHITGGGIPENLPRCIPSDFIPNINTNYWDIHIKFKFLKEKGSIPEKDFWNTFNLGVGFCLIIDKKFKDAILSICKNYDIDSWEIGKIVRKNDLTINSARLHFEPNGNLEQLIQATKNNLKLKIETQPYHQPSFGSVFKNPENNYAAKFIDDMGLKGFKIGGAEISTMHSNYIINTSSASSKDIYELITVIQQKVLQKKEFICNLK